MPSNPAIETSPGTLSPMSRTAAVMERASRSLEQMRAVERLFELMEGNGARGVEHLPFHLRPGGTIAAVAPSTQGPA